LPGPLFNVKLFFFFRGEFDFGGAGGGDVGDESSRTIGVSLVPFDDTAVGAFRLMGVNDDLVAGGIIMEGCMSLAAFCLGARFFAAFCNACCFFRVGLSLLEGFDVGGGGISGFGSGASSQSSFHSPLSLSLPTT
jgi:hypothetical protein